jgi:hypothetical protein
MRKGWLAIWGIRSRGGAPKVYRNAADLQTARFACPGAGLPKRRRRGMVGVSFKVATFLRLAGPEPPMHRLFPLAVLAVLSVVACSKPAPNSSAGASSTATSASASTGNACDRKLIVAADVAPLFSEAISGEKTIPGDLQSCEFDTVNFSSIQIAVRPGLGDVSVAQVKSGKTNQTVTPLAGVGDSAAWDPMLKEVDATKNNELCVIGAQGPAVKGATPATIGALCNKIFAAG